jgi:hypothetical protein
VSTSSGFYSDSATLFSDPKPLIERVTFLRLVSLRLVRGPLLAPRVVAQLECLFGPAYGQSKAGHCAGARMERRCLPGIARPIPACRRSPSRSPAFGPVAPPSNPVSTDYGLRCRETGFPGRGKKVQHVPRPTDQRSQRPSGRTTTPPSRGLSPPPQEISATAGMRGGPGRIRISNQFVMNLPLGGHSIFSKGTSPGARPTYATIEQNIRKSINGEKSNPPKPGRNRLPTAT